MTLYQRKSYLQNIEDAFKREKCVILTGPRQVGKTTLMKTFSQTQKKKPQQYINCEEYFSKDFSSLHEFVDRVQGVFNIDCRQEGFLFLDEIQTWNDPDRLIKSYYDNEEYICKILVTGSRFWGQQTLGASMVGRGEHIRIFRFSFFEYLDYHGYKHPEKLMYEDISHHIQQYILWGGYPAVIKAKSIKEKTEELQKILYTWIEKDFGYSLNKSYRVSFMKLLQFIAQNTGNICIKEHLAQHVGHSVSIIEKMISFISDSFIIHKIHPYYTDKSKEYSSHYEVYFHDTGLLNYLTGEHEMITGKMTESYIAAVLMTFYKEGKTFYYHKQNGSEIDFIFETSLRRLIPVEVKSGDRLSIPKVMYSFQDTYKKDIEKFYITTKTKDDQITKDENTFDFLPFWKAETIQKSL